MSIISMGSTLQGHACPSMPNCHTLPMLVCYKIYSQRRQKQSREEGGGGGGAASRKRAPYFTLANKQKSLILKKSLN